MSNQIEEKDWDPLVELLRYEVQEYGGLYNLLDRQQEEIFKRDPQSVLSVNEEIESYMQDMGALRQQREEQVERLAKLCGADDKASLSKLIPSFPGALQPMLQALVDEINQMIRRTRKKARQNHLLLSRTMEITHETLQMLQPTDYNKTYTKKGAVGVKRSLPTRYKAFV